MVKPSRIHADPVSGPYALAGVVNGTQNVLDSGLPTITVSGGYAVLGTANNYPQGRTTNTYELFDNMSWMSPFSATRHSFRFGVHDAIGDDHFDFDDSGEWLLAAVKHHGPIHAWRVDGTAAEILPRPMIDGRVLSQVESVIGVIGGFVVSGSNGKDFFAAHYDLTGRVCNAHVLQVVVGAILRKNVTAGARQNSPRIVGALIIPEDGHHARMVLFDLLVQRHQVGKLRRRRIVEKFFVINQGYGLQGDWISPNRLLVKHSLPRFREEFV